MKKKITAIMLAAFALTTGTFAFAGCKKHSHSYGKQVAEEEYMKSEATHSAKAVYYYSCGCGEKGKETFEYGETIPHTFDKEVVEAKYFVSAATIAEKAKYYYSCECGAQGTETFEYGTPIYTKGLKYALNSDRLGYTLTGIG
ncbi:MAG: hypothetical protein K2K04_01990, partial [Clostridia bacterium]|nr:hypothetical protein [Clostridia bacterium]